MNRPDANRIALRAARNILAAAHEFTFSLAGKRIHVAWSAQPRPAWKATEGLDEAADGPWPAPVSLEMSWEGGGSRLQLSCETWSASPEDRNAVSLTVTIPSTRRQVLWVTLALALGQAEDGRSVALGASVWPRKMEAGEAPAAHARSGEALRELVREAKVPFRTPWYAQVGEVEVPSGAVAPDAGAAFERMVIVAVAKHAWFERRERIGFTGVPFVEVPIVVEVEAGRGASGASGGGAAPGVGPAGRAEKRAGIWSLPGGVRSYATTLQALLADVDAREPLTVAGLEALFEERYQATGEAAVRGYRRMLRALGFVTEEGGKVELTGDGRGWLEAPDRAALFDRLHGAFIGMVEVLVLAELAPTLPVTRVREAMCHALGVEWRTDNQASFRRNWVLSLGLTERSARGDTLTAAGAEVLAAYADETDDARVALRAAIDALDGGPGGEPGEDGLGDDGRAEAGGEGGAGPDEAPRSPAGALWAHLDLAASTVEAHLGRLRLDPRTVEQLAAAVSAGKHLLFVGPPGTGKTELASALTRAAQAEGYCAGLFTATASAVRGRPM